LFELFDRMSGPANRMSRASHELEKTLIHTSRAVKQLGVEQDATERSSRGLFKELKELGTALGGWISVAKTARNVVGGIAGGFFDAARGALTFGVNTLAMRESTMATFELMEGNRDAAEALYNQAVEWARKTPFATGQVVDAFKQLRSAGFTREEVPILFAGLGDVAAAANFSGEVIGRVAYQMAQIKGTGKLQMVDLRPILGQLAGAGVGLTQIFDKVAARLGVTKDEVAGIMEAGGVSADVGIVAIMEAISDKGKGLGNVMGTLSGTLQGYFSRLESIAEDWFLSFDRDVDQMPGMVSFKNALKNVIDLFDVTTASGKRVQSTVLELFDTAMGNLFGGFEGAGGMARLELGVQTLIGALETAWTMARGVGGAVQGFFEGLAPALRILSGGAFDPKKPALFAEAMRGMGSQIGEAVGNMMRLVAAINSLFTLFSSKIGSEHGFSLGQALTRGLAFGVTGGNSEVLYSMGNLSDRLQGTFRSENEIQSPSRVYAQYGEHLAAGLAQGIESGSAGVDAALSGLGGSGIAVSPGGGRARAPVTVQLNIQVDNTGHQDGAEIARHIAELVPAQLQAAFEALALEMGEA
jgi:tape measure domain-containing protein